MAVQFSCPECDKVLKAANPIAPGKKVKCPSCGIAFAPTRAGRDDDGDEAPVRSKNVMPARKPAPPEDDDRRPRRDAVQSRRPAPAPPRDDEDEDRPARRDRSRREDYDDDEDRPARRSRKKQESSPVMLFVIIGAVVLVLGLGALGAFVWPGFLRGDGKAGGQAGPVAGPPIGPPGGPMGGLEGWVDVTSKEHQFTARMPRAAQQRTQNVGGLLQTIYYVEEGASAAYMIFHQNNPPLPKGSERALLQKAADAMNAAGRVTSSTPTDIQGYPAIDVYATVKMPAGAEVRNLIILADNTLYQVMVIGLPAFTRSPDAEKFVKSFKIVK